MLTILLQHFCSGGICLFVIAAGSHQAPALCRLCQKTCLRHSICNKMYCSTAERDRQAFFCRFFSWTAELSHLICRAPAEIIIRNGPDFTGVHCAGDKGGDRLPAACCRKRWFCILSLIYISPKRKRLGCGNRIRAVSLREMAAEAKYFYNN